MSLPRYCFETANVATEDEAEKQTKLLVDAFIKENPNAERSVSGLASSDAIVALLMYNV